MLRPGTIELADGRWIYLRELRQYETYEGLLEGLPVAKRNKTQVERLVNDNRVKYPRDKEIREPYLITPTETPIEYMGGKPYPFGTPSALPSITCIGRFNALAPVRDETDDDGSSYEGSSLIVLWYQDQFALPIAPDILTLLVALDWEKYAINECY